MTQGTQSEPRPSRNGGAVILPRQSGVAGGQHVFSPLPSAFASDVYPDMPIGKILDPDENPLLQNDSIRSNSALTQQALILWFYDHTRLTLRCWMQHYLLN